MRLRVLIVATVAAVIVGLAWTLAVGLAQGSYMQVDKLRFRLVGDEPIAAPDGRGTVAGMKVLVLRDTRSDQCFIAIVSGVRDVHDGAERVSIAAG